jgi:hypothetical protein
MKLMKIPHILDIKDSSSSMLINLHVPVT